MENAERETEPLYCEPTTRGGQHLKQELANLNSTDTNSCETTAVSSRCCRTVAVPETHMDTLSTLALLAVRP